MIIRYVNLSLLTQQMTKFTLLNFVYLVTPEMTSRRLRTSKKSEKNFVQQLTKFKLVIC